MQHYNNNKIIQTLTIADRTGNIVECNCEENPKTQLEPIGERVYIELYSIK